MQPVIVITGGSSGIGRATAIRFAREGWKVGLIARGEAGLAASEADVRALGASCAVAIADVADSAALEQATDQIIAALGPIALWINAAGNGVYGRLLDVPEAEYRRVTEVTYMGTVNGTRAALRRMLPANSGTILNVCSGTVFAGLPLMTAYVGAKAAVRGFSQSVRAELRLANSRVHLCTLFPPAVNTPFFSHSPTHMGFPARPVAPVYQPEIIAQAIYLAATGKNRRRETIVSSILLLFSLVSRLSPSLAAWLTERLRIDQVLSADPCSSDSDEPSLFAPPTRIFSVRGRFGGHARAWSAQVWLMGALGGRFMSRPPRTLAETSRRALRSPHRPVPASPDRAPAD